MTCKQCGAEYQNNLLQCPYCHSENPKEAKKQKRSILESYDKEAAAIKKEAEQYPEKAANKYTKMILVVLGIAIALGILAIWGYGFLGKVFFKLEMSGKENHMEKLESYLEEGNPAAVSAYMDEKDLYTSIYDKYSEVANIYDYLQDMQESKAQIKDIAGFASFSMEEKKECADSWLGWYIKDAHQALILSREYTEDKVFRGNEEMILSLQENVLAELRETGFTREEIERLYVEEAESLEDLEERLFEMLIQ